ncbi:MAG: histidine phosphatase family protein [Alphaproteobacteria bacterium]|nr:histidine phosphatase family protein [Alphaproteobacteria bacterium]
MTALPGTTGRRRIYLMRHGHVDYFSKTVTQDGRPDLVTLTETGVAQAEAAGDALAHVRFDLALCSGYPRTRQTAEIVLSRNAQKDHLTLEEDARLIELKGGGQGLKLIKNRSELSARMAFEFDRASEPDASMFGGELFSAALQRCSESVRALLARPHWHTALVVAHEGVNRLVLSWCTGNGLKGVQAFEQDLACINIIDFDLVPKEGADGTEIVRSMIKTVNLTPYNWVKHGMNLTSLEAIFAST